MRKRYLIVLCMMLLICGCGSSEEISESDQSAKIESETESGASGSDETKPEDSRDWQKEDKAGTEDSNENLNTEISERTEIDQTSASESKQSEPLESEKEKKAEGRRTDAEGFAVTLSVSKYFDAAFSEGLAWATFWNKEDQQCIGIINEKEIGMRIQKAGLYSNGYIPLQLEDENRKRYLTLVNTSGQMLYEPMSFEEYQISGMREMASYNGYIGIRGSGANADFMIVTPSGEIKSIGDDLSEMGNEAYMYVTDGCTISGGYMFGMNHDTAYDRLCTKDGEYLDEAYVSLDGTKIIDKVFPTDATKGLSQLGNALEQEEDVTSKIAEALAEPSDQFSLELAKIAALMSERSESTSHSGIKELYERYGIEDMVPSNYDEPIFGGGAAAIGKTKLDIDGIETDVLFITCRGSVTPAEFVGDLFKGWINGDKTPFLDKEVWGNNYDFEEKVWEALSGYLAQYPELSVTEHLKIVVNGHSLGGAAASMLGARIDNEIKNGQLFNSHVTVSDVFVYTFGAIKVVTSDTNVAEGYRNIHNIYNYYDAFGYRGNYAWTEASSAHAKFGHTELFEIDRETSLISNKNHWMSAYRDALELEDICSGFIRLSCDPVIW